MEDIEDIKRVIKQIDDVNKSCALILTINSEEYSFINEMCKQMILILDKYVEE